MRSDTRLSALNNPINKGVYSGYLVLTMSAHSESIGLKGFVTGQIEEEAKPFEIIQKLRRIGKDGNGLFLIDKDLAQRVFTPALDWMGEEAVPAQV